MAKKIYGTERYERIGTVNLGELSMNGVYTASFYLNSQFADWYQSGLTNVIDQEIPEDRYIGEIAPGVPKLTRFITCEYNETYVDPVELQRSLENVGARFDVDIFESIEEARQWLRDNTSLEEIEPGKFLIQAEMPGLIEGEVVPAQYLIVE